MRDRLFHLTFLLNRCATVACRGASRSAALLLLSSFLLSGCSARASALETRGPAAERIADLWWLFFWLGTLVWLLVTVLLLFALFRRRREGADDLPRAVGGNTPVILGGVALPAVILLVLYASTLATMGAIPKHAPSQDLAIVVNGRQWWWEVQYPNHGITTANEIHIPAGQSVEVQLTSEDVIHSFWVPQLHGKVDMIPGKTTSIVLQADQPGTYFGECAEFCGVQHAKMQFLVIADPPDRFAAWLEQQQAPAADVTGTTLRQGQQVFLGSACVYCHTVKGTPASGDLGPDLTHLASRQMLAAGTVPNTRGYLAGWIVNPHGIKPGNRMPPTHLGGEELQALLDYLESLK